MRVMPGKTTLLRSVLRLPEPTDTSVMNLAFVIVFGGGVTVLTLLLLPPRPANLVLPPNLAVAGVAALAAAVVWLLRHRPLSAPVIHALTAFGTVLITVVVAFGGDVTPQFAVFYVWMIVYAAAFFTLAGWGAHVGLAAAGYLLAAWIHPTPDQLLAFIPVVAGPAVVVGGFVHVVASRMRTAAQRLLECVQVSGHMVTEAPEAHNVLATICQGTRRACDAATATLLVPDSDGEWAVVAADGPEPTGAVELEELTPLLEEPRRRLGQHARVEPWLVDSDDGARGSRLVHPLQDDELIGVLVVDWDTTVARLSDLAAHLLRAYAQQASTALRYHRVHESLTQLAATDALTGLPNRRAFETAMTAYDAARRRGNDTVAVALFDLDGFKAFNDRHGHAAGDDLLRTIANAWQERVRDEDLLARLGGDEFALLAPGTTLTGTAVLAQDLCALVPSAEVSCSAGVAVGIEGEPLADLVEAVDRYLYAAKQDGGGVVHVRAVTAPDARCGARPPA